MVLLAGAGVQKGILSRDQLALALGAQLINGIVHLLALVQDGSWATAALLHVGHFCDEGAVSASRLEGIFFGIVLGGIGSREAGG